MSASLEDVMVYLARIDAKLDAMGKFSAAPAGERAKSIGGEGAADVELDDKFGDAPIRRDPSAKYWNGRSYAGTQPSQCPIDYLLAQVRYKEACVFMGEKNADPAKAKYVEYDRRDARLYRGWIRRLESGWKPKQVAGSGLPFDTEDVATTAARYGTSAAGSSAKHTGSPEPADEFTSDVDDIPFATSAIVPRIGDRTPKWERF